MVVLVVFPVSGPYYNHGIFYCFLQEDEFFFCFVKKARLIKFVSSAWKWSASLDWLVGGSTVDDEGGQSTCDLIISSFYCVSDMTSVDWEISGGRELKISFAGGVAGSVGRRLSATTKTTTFYSQPYRQASHGWKRPITILPSSSSSLWRKDDESTVVEQQQQQQEQRRTLPMWAGKHRATVCQLSCIRRVVPSTTFLFRPIRTISTTPVKYVKVCFCLLRQKKSSFVFRVLSAADGYRYN